MTQAEALEVLKSGANVFLTGEPGAGKSYTINLFTEWLRQRGTVYAVTASTGIAATHVNGVTLHSWSGIKMKRKISDAHLEQMASDRFHVERVSRPKVLIVDEVSMIDAKMVDMLDIILRHFRDPHEPFGGIQVVFVGDFFQLPPVDRHNETKFAFQSEAWNAANLQVCYLTEQHRQEDPEFLEILTAMRKGTITQAHKDRLLACTKNGTSPTHLFTHNADVDAMNTIELEKIDKPLHEFKMEMTGVHPAMEEVLQRQLITPATLRLKEGALVMFTWNDAQGQFVNGTIGKVDGFTISGAPIVIVKENRIIPQKQVWRLEENGKEKATATQYPLRLAWAITVHKSQGMSLDEATIDLSKTFEYGQGYVAISRVKSLQGLHITGMNDKTFEMHPKVIRKDKEFRTSVMPKLDKAIIPNSSLKKAEDLLDTPF